MPIPTRLPDAPPDPLANRQRRRLCQVLWLLVGAFVLVVGINLASGAARTAELED